MKIKSNLFLLLFLAIILISSCNSNRNKEDFVLYGQIDGFIKDSSKVTLYNLDKYTPIRFISYSKKGKYTIRGHINSPEIFILKIEGVKDSLTLFIENSIVEIISVSEDFLNSKISGLDDNYKIISHLKELESIASSHSINEIKSALDSGKIIDKTTLLTFENRLRAYKNELNRADSIFFLNYPTSPYILYRLAQKPNEYSYDFKINLINYFEKSENYDKNRFLDKIRKLLFDEKDIEVESIVPEIKLLDTSNHILDLAKIVKKNKSTLLYFHKTDCIPCIYHEKGLLYTYNAFKFRGLEIVSISLDNSFDFWRKSVKANKYPWKTMFARGGFSSEASNRFGVDSLPYFVLIDSLSKVQYKNIDKKNIRKRVREYLYTKKELEEFYNSLKDSSKTPQAIIVR